MTKAAPSGLDQRIICSGSGNPCESNKWIQCPECFMWKMCSERIILENQIGVYGQRTIPEHELRFFVGEDVLIYAYGLDDEMIPAVIVEKLSPVSYRVLVRPSLYDTAQPIRTLDVHELHAKRTPAPNFQPVRYQVPRESQRWKG